MIPHFCEGVAEVLRGRGFPFPVLYAPEVLERGKHGNLVTFERSRGGGEAFGPPEASGTPKGPQGRRVATWEILGTVKVYAQSPAPSPAIMTHETWGDHLVGMVVCALIDWARDNRHSLAFSPGGYAPPEERGEGMQPAGLVYTIPIVVKLGIFRQKYDALLPDIGTIAAVDNIPGAPPDPP